jgi:hypothetical protein
VRCEAWAAILREGHRFESRVLTKILGLKMEEEAAEWRKLNLEELCC